MTSTQGFTLWLTGLSGSGKSTIAEHLLPQLQRLGLRVEHLDGDELRQHLTRDLGFSLQDRLTNIERVSYVAKLLTRNGVVSIVSFISPTRAMRAMAREMIGRFAEIHVDCTLEECLKRDVKGLYAKALRGEIPNFTGVSQVYEEPLAPEIRVQTHTTSLEACSQHILSELQRQNFLQKFATQSQQPVAA